MLCAPRCRGGGGRVSRPGAPGLARLRRACWVGRVRLPHHQGDTEPGQFLLRLCVLTISSLFAAPGCSLFVGSLQRVAITATDPSAEIIVDGQPAGKGSVVLDLPRDRSHAILARAGDRVGMAQVGTVISTTGVLDIVGGVLFLFPLLGLLGPGFWSLEKDSVVVPVPPPPVPASPGSDAPRWADAAKDGLRP